jgi:methionyl-tRNA formyltransferase
MAGLRVALAAEDAAGRQALKVVADRGDQVVALFSGDGSGGDGANPIREEAAAHGALVRDAVDVRDPASGALLREQEVDVLLSVHCRHAIADALLGAPRLGSFNLHPGPLPEVAGLHPTSWTVYEGLGEHGVTLHRMTAELDAGDVVAQERFPVGPADSAIDVLSQCVRREKALLSGLLDELDAGGEVRADAQDLGRRRWFGAAPEEAAGIDWGWSSRKLARLVLACDYRPFDSPWGRLSAVVRGQRIELLEAEVADGDPGGLPGTVSFAPDGAALVVTGAGRLQLNEIGLEGDELLPEEFLRDGDRLEMLSLTRAGDRDG